MHFADASNQPTPGNRGKTTRRKSTRTVRGPEGAWIAEMKEEQAAASGPKPVKAPPTLGMIATLFVVECPHPSGQRLTEYGVNMFEFSGEAEARAKAVGLPGAVLRRKDTIRYIPPGKRKPRERTEWVDVQL